MKNTLDITHRWETMKTQLSPSSVLLILGVAVASPLAIALVLYNPIYGFAAVGALLMGFMIIFRWDVLIVTLIVPVWLLVDSYLGFRLVSILMGLVMLSVCYLGRSAKHPWVKPRAIWLWILFLTLTIYPAINGALDLYDADTFYPSFVLSAFIMFWLGNIIAKDISAVRRAFQLLSMFAALIAIHTIIEATTGKFLFESARASAALAQNSYLLVAQVSRAGSFLGHPNQNGAFLALNFFLPLGLFMESKQFWTKMIYLLEMLLILSALLFTYSTGSWMGLLVGLLVFVIFVGQIRSGVLLLMLMAILAVIAFTIFSSQIALLLSHASSANDSSMHLGGWQTAIRVIEAYPLTGIGLGNQAYLLHATPLMVPAQQVPLTEPDNTYLEWGAMAGIPVMLIFILLLGYVFWASWRIWRAIDVRYRPLLGCGIAALVALSINSLTVDAWSGQIGKPAWLIAGLVTSPFLIRYLRK